MGASAGAYGWLNKWDSVAGDACRQLPRRCRSPSLSAPAPPSPIRALRTCAGQRRQLTGHRCSIAERNFGTRQLPKLLRLTSCAASRRATAPLFGRLLRFPEF